MYARVVTAQVQPVNADEAAADFDDIWVWAEQQCASRLMVYDEGTGYVNCRFSNEGHKIYQQGRWIVHIFASDAAPAPPNEFVDTVRDAVAKHWETLE